MLPAPFRKSYYSDGTVSFSLVVDGPPMHRYYFTINSPDEIGVPEGIRLTIDNKISTASLVKEESVSVIRRDLFVGRKLLFRRGMRGIYSVSDYVVMIIECEHV
jgi:hypothetical protein